MKVLRTLLGETDVSLAVVEVDEREIADVDEMLRLMDEIHGDYSLTVRFVAADAPPNVKSIGQHEFALRTSSPRNLDSLRDHKRYYEVSIKHVAD